MEIGSDIWWRSRRYVLVGVDPTTVPDRRAYLRDRETGEAVAAPFEELSSDPDDDVSGRQA